MKAALKGHIALVGRPNTGKSCLFNRLLKKRKAIVHNQEGVTRDINYAPWLEGKYILMDTGGIGLKPQATPTEIHEAVETQVALALTLAEVIVWVVEADASPTQVEANIAEKLRTWKRKVILVANKIDRCGGGAADTDWLKLGFPNTCSVSAEHGQHIAELIDLIEEKASCLSTAPKSQSSPIYFCLRGKTNAGKSSLANALLGEKKILVDDQAGTTRDTVEGSFTWQEGEEEHLFYLADTAGTKPQRKLASSLEYFSQLRAEEATETSDTVVLVLDALMGPTQHDKSIAKGALDRGKALIVAVSKWDLAKATFSEGNLPDYPTLEVFQKTFSQSLKEAMPFLPESPIAFTSAKEKKGTEQLLESLVAINATLRKGLPTSQLNSCLKTLFEKSPPQRTAGKLFKIYYALQVNQRPFVIRVFCNKPSYLQSRYEKYLSKSLRRSFALQGCPIVWDWVGKPPRETWKPSKKQF